MRIDGGAVWLHAGRLSKAARIRHPEDRTMNAIRTLTIAALMSASTLSLAADPAAGMRWDCTRTGAPSHREIATAFNFDNYAMARNLQPRLYTELRRGCKRGAAAVLLVSKPNNEFEVRAIAAR